MAVTPVAGVVTQTSSTAGASTLAVNAGQNGGYIVNPASNTDQGISTAEVLLVDPVAPISGSLANKTTLALQPGQIWYIIPLSNNPVYVASVTTNHKFTNVVW